MKLELTRKYKVVEMAEFETIGYIDTEDPIYINGNDGLWYPTPLKKDEYIIPVWEKDTSGDLRYDDIIEYLLVTIEVQQADPDGGYNGEIIVIDRFSLQEIKLIKTPLPVPLDSSWPTDVWDINSVHYAIIKVKKII